MQRLLLSSRNILIGNSLIVNNSFNNVHMINNYNYKINPMNKFKFNSINYDIGKKNKKLSYKERVRLSKQDNSKQLNKIMVKNKDLEEIVKKEMGKKGKKGKKQKEKMHSLDKRSLLISFGAIAGLIGGYWMLKLGLSSEEKIKKNYEHSKEISLVEKIQTFINYVYTTGNVRLGDVANENYRMYIKLDALLNSMLSPHSKFEYLNRGEIFKDLVKRLKENIRDFKENDLDPENIKNYKDMVYILKSIFLLLPKNKLFQYEDIREEIKLYEDSINNEDLGNRLGYLYYSLIYNNNFDKYLLNEISDALSGLCLYYPKLRNGFIHAKNPKLIEQFNETSDVATFLINKVSDQLTENHLSPTYQLMKILHLISTTKHGASKMLNHPSFLDNIQDKVVDKFSYYYFHRKEILYAQNIFQSLAFHVLNSNRYLTNADYPNLSNEEKNDVELEYSISSSNNNEFITSKINDFRITYDDNNNDIYINNRNHSLYYENPDQYFSDFKTLKFRSVDFINLLHQIKVSVFAYLLSLIFKSATRENFKIINPDLKFVPRMTKFLLPIGLTAITTAYYHFALEFCQSFVISTNPKKESDLLKGSLLPITFFAGSSLMLHYFHPFAFVGFLAMLRVNSLN